MDYGLQIQHGDILRSMTEDDLTLPELEPLPNEEILHQTRGRTSLDISAPPPSPGIPPFSLKSDRGVAYITSKRVGASWGGFGANYWDAEVRPEPDGNIPADYTRVTMRLTFNDGGHSDWALKYENIRGRLLHAASVARETGNAHVLNAVTAEQLPEYSPREGGSRQSQIIASQVQVEREAEEAAREREDNQPLPDEPPPDYDEAQAQAIAMQFDERQREDAERGR
ncbi:putative GRAM domain-containing protein [Seiridium cardinale]|uniref:GRAM domain-containing protein n=1 Tax=Seiridium cardinale TaxID=138064 RepID=A0ABR2Y299_9PEZI